ncbi:11643_t:CDS:2 [Diversispora eburnea]|uniref:11643_t:CDS:1 n=1 Tax=Diversispora eburnea TaxID=1213867 RepID=A0A9N9C8Z1_9GLOM|nr:11643_t:CDS:2 [Diversispora eburnea]
MVQKQNVLKGNDCSTYFEAKSEDNFESLGYNLAYLPKGQISMKASEKEYLMLLINITDDTYDFFNQSGMNMQAFDSETIELPYTNGTFDNIYAIVYIILKTPGIEIEKEQKSRTAIEVLANIAALYGVTFSIYALLFGVKTSKPLLAKFMPAEDPSDDSKV